MRISETYTYILHSTILSYIPTYIVLTYILRTYIHIPSSRLSIQSAHTDTSIHTYGVHASYIQNSIVAQPNIETGRWGSDQTYPSLFSVPCPVPVLRAHDVDPSLTRGVWGMEQSTGWSIYYYGPEFNIHTLWRGVEVKLMVWLHSPCLYYYLYPVIGW